MACTYLQNFTISQDALGITHISDLTRQSDLDKVRVLALLELTVTLDDHNIPLRTLRATKTKTTGTGQLVGGQNGKGLVTHHVQTCTHTHKHTHLHAHTNTPTQTHYHTCIAPTNTHACIHTGYSLAPLTYVLILISENGVFGIPLSVLLANDRKRDPMATIPLVFKEVTCKISF